MDAKRGAVQALLDPKSVAIVGASNDPKRMSGVIVHQIERLGFTGAVYPVNPKYDEIAGFRCLDDVEELRDNPPDVVVIFLRAEVAIDVARSCADIGVKALIVLSAGFAELGEEGRVLQDRLAAICRESGMAMCGPNTAGMASFNSGFVAIGASGFSGLSSFRSGDVAILSSSGGLGTSLFSYCQARRVGVSHLIGIGNEAVTSAADYLDALVDDPNVSCVIALLEALRDADAFFAAADRALQAGKAVIVMKQGRSEVGLRSIQTHTAAMGGEAASIEAACRAHGVVTVRELQALADHAMTFSRLPDPSNYRLGILSLPGGGTSLLADPAGDHGFELPPLTDTTRDQLRDVLPPIAVAQNPLDPTAGFGRDGDRLRAGLRIFAADEGTDLVTFFQSATEATYALGLAEAVAEVAQGHDKPFLCIWESGPGLEEAWDVLHDANIPLFVSASDCFATLASHRWYHRFRVRYLADDERDYGPLADSGIGELVAENPHAVDPDRFLDMIGVRRPRQERVLSASQAVAAAEVLGTAVALKAIAPGLIHKTEAGGVRLGLTTATVASAYDDLVASVESAEGAGAVEAVIIQEMVPDGVELLIGVHTDDQVGPMLTLGFGGVLTEVVEDIARRPVPVTRLDVDDMLSELRSAQLLRGFRGAPPADEEAFIEVALRVSWAAHTLRDYRPEIELNPVIVGAGDGGAVAVDAVIGFAS